MKACVIQIARIGDLAQSVALIRALHQSGRSVTLICAQDPGDWIRQWCDTVVCLDPRELLKFSHRAHDLLAYLHHNLLRFVGKGFDECYCLNDSPPALELANLIRTERHFGFSDRQSMASAWMRAMGKKRQENLVHLSEWQLALNPELGAEISAAQVRVSGPLVIHCGSGSSARQLNESFWSQVFGVILKLDPGAKLLLSGSLAEAELTEKLARLDSRIQSIAGQTNLDQLLGLIESARGLLAQDTGVLHLAALTSTPVMGLYYGNARAIETGPFQHGAVVCEIIADCHPCLEGHPDCGTYECRTWLSAQKIAMAFLAQVNGEDLPESADPRSHFLRVNLESGAYALHADTGDCRLDMKRKQRQLAILGGKSGPPAGSRVLAEAAGRQLSHSDLMKSAAQLFPADIEEHASHWHAASCLSLTPIGEGPHK